MEKETQYFDFGRNLLRIRKKKFTQEELGAIVGVSGAQIGRYEKNIDNVPIETILGIAKALHVRPGELFGEQDENITSVKNTVKKVPLYDAIAVGGNSMLSDQTPLSEPIELVDPGDLLRSATGMLRVYGHSMYPKYPAGCMVAFKRGQRDIPSVIVWGEDYIIELEDRRIIKKVDRSEVKDCIKAVSYNTNNPKYTYDPIDIPMKDVKRMYMVLGKVELEASI